MELGGATIVWFRQDLRLEDNPALSSAVARGGPVIPVYIWAPEEEGKWAPGAASRWWLHRSLSALDAALRSLGSRLLLRRGASLAILEELALESGASAVHWNRRYEPAAVARELARAYVPANGVLALAGDFTGLDLRAVLAAGGQIGAEPVVPSYIAPDSFFDVFLEVACPVSLPAGTKVFTVTTTAQLAAGPVPARSTTWGALKGLYR